MKGSMMNLKDTLARPRMLLFAVVLTVLGGTPAMAQSTSAVFITVDGGRIWYQTCGSGLKAVVLIHDGLLHSASWDDVWPILCKDFHVVRYDRRGFGRSPAATAPYSPVDDLAAVLHAARLEHVVLVGSSSGGGLAVDFTLQHPQAVNQLVLVGPTISGLAQSQYFRDRVAAMGQRIQRGDLEGALRDSWAFAPGHEAALKRVVSLLAANPQNLNHPDPAHPAPVARLLLPLIKVPTLILIGEYDIADNHAEAGAAEALIPGANRIVVRDTGHLLYLEHPDVFATLVVQFANGTLAVGQ
jgi:pimeloyl-ACP methyl ester carboxylesterase